jgi:Tfp pilus assembly protein PilN
LAEAVREPILRGGVLAITGMPGIALARVPGYPIAARNRFAAVGVYDRRLRAGLLKENWMKMRLAALFGALMLASASVFAFHCPADMRKIDDALAKNPKLSSQQLADVKKFRADGEALHKAGKHQESVDTLAKAMKILGI